MLIDLTTKSQIKKKLKENFTHVVNLSGYTLTLSAQELKPANFLEGATSADPFAGQTGTVTVTEGTNS